MSKETESPTAPARIFATAPSDIVVFEETPFDEPIMELSFDAKGKTDGIRRETGRNRGKVLSVRSEKAHIEGKIAHPIDGGDPIPYGPGLAGHWAKHARSGK